MGKTLKSLRGDLSAYLLVALLFIDLAYFIVYALYSLAFLCIISYAIGGWPVIIVGLIFFVITVWIAPIYAVVAWGYWMPLAVVYGGGLIVLLLKGLKLLCVKLAPSEDDLPDEDEKA